MPPEKSTTKSFISVSSSCRKVLGSSLNPSCCRARRFSHARSHMLRKQQLTITSNPLIKRPVRTLLWSLHTNSSFFFCSPDQVPKPIITPLTKTHCFWAFSKLVHHTWKLQSGLQWPVCVFPAPVSQLVPHMPVSVHLLPAMTGGRHQWLAGGCGAWCWSGDMVKCTMASSRCVVPTAKPFAGAGP